MVKNIEIKPYSEDQLDAVLSLSARSISTTRTQQTWLRNDMTAILAYDKSRLIGAIPLEKRKLTVGDGRFIKVLWVSGAHVDSDYRSIGIGTEMDRRISEYFSTVADGIFVYRGDPDSQAFQWYRKNGYRVINPIFSLHKHLVKDSVHARGYQVLTQLSEVREYGSRLFDSFQEKYNHNGGYTVRSSEYWARIFTNHLYREYFRYFILVVPPTTAGRLVYAFLGETSIGDNISRLDIFEFIAIEEEDRTALENAIEDFGKKRGVNSFRIRFTVGDPDISWFSEQGYLMQRCFYLMAHFFSDKLTCFSIDEPINVNPDYCLINPDTVFMDWRFISQTENLDQEGLSRGKTEVDFSRSFHCDYI